MDKRLIFSFVVAFIALPICQLKVVADEPEGAQIWLSHLGVLCHWQRNDAADAPELVRANIPLFQPDVEPTNWKAQEDAKGTRLWGTGWEMTGNFGHRDCNGNFIPYKEYSIKPDWVVFQEHSDPPLHPNVTLVRCSHVENKLYWDNYYSGYGYEVPDKCDYSQNCHGFSFGFGGWLPDPMLTNSNGLWIGLGGEGTPIGGNLGNGSPDSLCYEVTAKKFAEIAVSSGHSIKVTGGECDPPLNIDCFTSPHGLFPQDDNDPCNAQAIFSSSEQFRESGTYSRTGDCDDPLGVGQPHSFPDFTFIRNAEL